LFTIKEEGEEGEKRVQSKEGGKENMRAIKYMPQVVREKRTSRSQRARSDRSLQIREIQERIRESGIKGIARRK